MNRVITVVLLAVVTILPFATASASDQTGTNYACVLDESLVVPLLNPYPYGFVGRIDLTLNESNELSYEIYDCYGLSQYDAHIHGPALPGAIGPVIFTIPAASSGVTSYRTGVLGVLDNQQIRDLNCALWYVDVHTAEYPLGFVRGQLRGLWGWQPGWPCFLPAEASTWGAVKALYK